MYLFYLFASTETTHKNKRRKKIIIKYSNMTAKYKVNHVNTCRYAIENKEFLFTLRVRLHFNRFGSAI